MVRGHAGGQPVQELVEAERDQVLLVDPRGATLRSLPDPVGFGARGQAHAGLAHPLHAAVAARPAEDEVDRGKHVRLRQDLHDLLAPWCVDAAVPLPRAVHPMRLDRVAAHPAVLLDPELLLIERDHVRVRQQDALLLDVHRVEATTDQVVVLQRHGPAFLDHDGRLPAERLDPLAELLGVRDGRRQADDRGREREVDQHLLPHGAAVRVLEVVDLVHDHGHQPVEGAAALVEHVAEHLGGHHDHGRLGVDGVVSGQQTDAIRAVSRHQVAVLLVGERLQRRGVERLAAPVERSLDRELRHDGLARTRGGGHQHRPTGVHGVDRRGLEVVERERVLGGERRGGDHGRQSTGGSGGRGQSGRQRSRWCASSSSNAPAASRFDR